MLTTNELEQIKQRLEECRCQDCKYEFDIVNSLLKEIEKHPATAIQIGIMKSAGISELEEK